MFTYITDHTHTHTHTHTHAQPGCLNPLCCGARTHSPADRFGCAEPNGGGYPENRIVWGTHGVLTGTHGVLTVYSQGYSGVLTGYSRGALRPGALRR